MVEFYLDAWKRMMLSKCYVIYMMELQVDTMEVKTPHIKFLEFGTIGRHYLRMHMHMHGSVKFSKLHMEGKIDKKFHFNM